MSEDAKSETEVRRRIRVGVNEVEGINDRHKGVMEIERESSDVVCNAGLPLQSGHVGTDRDNRSCRFARTTESGGLWE